MTLRHGYVITGSTSLWIRIKLTIKAPRLKQAAVSPGCHAYAPHPWRLTFRRGFAKNLSSFVGAFRASLERKQGTPWIEEGWHRSEPWHANVYTVECFARIRGRRQTSELHARRSRTLRDANGH